MPADQNPIREQFQTIIGLYNQSIATGNLEAAYAYIVRLCEATSFKHAVLNDYLFTVLSQLHRFADAYEFAECAAKSALASDAVEAILYNYQTVLFLQKKAGLQQNTVLVQTMKDALWRHAQQLKEKYRLMSHHAIASHARPRIGHLIGLVSPGHAPTKMVIQEIKYIDHASFDMRIFTTEWAARWLFSAQDEPAPQSYYDDLNAAIRTTYQTLLHVADSQLSFCERAIAVCRAIIAAEIDILIVNATDAEAITMLVAMFKPVPIMLNAVHGGAMPLENFDGYIQLQRDDFLTTTDTPQHYLSITSDIQNDLSSVHDTKIQQVLESLRAIKSTCVLTGTYGSLFKIDNEAYLLTLIHMLRAFPNMIHVLVGWGEYEPIKKKLSTAGVLDQVRYVGFQKNIKPFMEILDVYLASFPYPGHTCELECMALGKPVVSMAWQEGHHYNSGARVVELAECIAPQNDTEAYARIVHQFISNKKVREKIGKKLQQRFNKHFSPAARTKKVEKLYISLLKSK